MTTDILFGKLPRYQLIQISRLWIARLEPSERLIIGSPIETRVTSPQVDTIKPWNRPTGRPYCQKDPHGNI